MGSMFQLTASTITVRPDTRIIKTEDIAKLHEASDIVEAAKKRAEQILAEAQSDIERMRQQGYEEGREEGRLEHSEKLMETVLQSVEFIENIEATIVDVVNQAIRKVIGDIDDKERIVRIVRTALASVRNQQQVTVRVAPTDEGAVSEALSAMLTSVPGSPSFLNVVADSRLEPNSCILESELGVVDASLETQLKAFENAFKAKIQA